MSKFCGHNELRSADHPPSRRVAFSLAELVVAVGLLLLLLALTGQVFSLTSRSTGQATALTNTHQLLRSFEQTIRKDLCYVREGDSVLLIYGNPVNAYWTQTGKDADDNDDPSDGYPHPADPERECGPCGGIPLPPRADVLMFFTAHKTASRVFPSVISQAQQVVYAHASFGQYVPNPSGGFAFVADLDAFPKFDEIAPLPANGWHLARRSVLLVPAAAPLIDSAGRGWAASLFEDGEIEETISVLKGTSDVVSDFVYETEVLTPGPMGPWRFLPNVFYDGSGDMAPIFDRSLLDLTPPPSMAHSLGHYFIPHCASFKVEWSLKPHSAFVDGRLDSETQVLWFDPGNMDDPLASLTEAIQEAEDTGDSDRYLALSELRDDELGGDANYRYSLADRFRDDMDWFIPPADDNPGLAIFTATRQSMEDGVAGEAISEDVFPGALRITIDMFDPQGHFDRPIRHVMVIPVGE